MKWGLRWELCIIIVFIICLLIATFGLNRFGLLSSEGNEYVRYIGVEEGDTYSYSDLESKISQAGRKYYNNHYPNGVKEDVIVSADRLISAGYLSPLYDGKRRRCTGYAHITTNGTSFGYVKCHRYRTEGYNLDE